MVARPRNVRLAKLTPFKGVTKSQPAAAAAKPLKPGTVSGFKAGVGRPESNVGKYLVKPTDKSKTGYEMLNTDPAAVSQAEEKFLKNYELPPALQPKYLRKPEIMETARRKEISKGWIKPRSQV